MSRLNLLLKSRKGNLPRRIKILLIGPLPPPVGGATVLYKQLVDDLSGRDDIGIWALNSSSPKHSLCSRILWTIYLVWQMTWLVPRADAVSLHASLPSTLILGPLIWFFCKVFRKKSMLRKFGGVFDQEFGQLSSVQRWVIKNTVLDMDLLLFETKHLVRHFRRNASKPVAWFPNNRPVPSDLDSLTPSATSRCAKRFVYVGHVMPCKGIREIIEASNEIEEDIVVDIYGPLRDGLTVDEIVGQKVVYRGILLPDEVTAILRRYDVLLMPTYCPTEGYPGVVVESYCAGIPVIATRLNAISEIVDQTSGILVEPRDVDGLRDAMLQLILSSEEYIRLQEGARKKALEFSSEIWTERFVRLTLGLLTDQGCSSGDAQE